MFKIYFLKICYLAFIYYSGKELCVAQWICGGQRAALWSSFSSTVDSSVKYRLSCLWGKCLYSLVHLASPNFKISYRQEKSH